MLFDLLFWFTSFSYLFQSISEQEWARSALLALPAPPVFLTLPAPVRTLAISASELFSLPPVTFTAFLEVDGTALVNVSMIMPTNVPIFNFDVTPIGSATVAAVTKPSPVCPNAASPAFGEVFARDVFACHRMPPVLAYMERQVSVHQSMYGRWAPVPPERLQDIWQSPVWAAGRKVPSDMVPFDPANVPTTANVIAIAIARCWATVLDMVTDHLYISLYLTLLAVGQLLDVLRRCKEAAKAVSSITVLFYRETILKGSADASTFLRIFKPLE